MLLSVRRFAVSCFFQKRFVATSCYRCVQTAVPAKEPDRLSNGKFPEQRVEIRTCGKLYENWRKQKRFRKIPDGDLSFTVRYIDTLKNENISPQIKDDSPVILALHGAPGSYEDFNRFTSFMWERGARVIAPHWPDFSDYNPGVFRHSASEKAQFIKDFLKAIHVNYLDLLVCHSSAVYPSLQLCCDNIEPRISSLGLFNPGAFQTSMRAVRPWHLMRAFVKMCENPVGLQVAKITGPAALKLIKSPVLVQNYLDPLLSATTMTYAGIPEAKHLFHKLHLRKFPIFLAFSEDDKMIDKELSYKIAYTLGVQDPDIYHFNEQNVLDRKGRPVYNTKVFAFENGTHYVFSKRSEIVNNEIYKFLQDHVL